MTSIKDAVISALSDQVVCYERLAKLAEIQHVHVQNSQTDALLDVLQQRQHVLDQVADLEQTVAPARKRWLEYLAELDSDDRTSAESLLAETRRLLEQITTADRNDAIVLQQRKLSLGRQINAAQSARTINRNYATAAYGARPSSLNIKQ